MNNIGDLLIHHGPSGIRGRGEDVLPEICKWIHKNRPEQLCYMEGIFQDPTLNRPCPRRREVNNAKNS